MPNNSLVFITSQIDDLLNIELTQVFDEIKSKIKSFFDCSGKGKMKEYIGYKIDRDCETQPNKLKIMQLVIIQSFADEFDLLSKNPVILMPARHITKKDKENKLIDKDK